MKNYVTSGIPFLLYQSLSLFLSLSLFIFSSITLFQHHSYPYPHVISTDVWTDQLYADRRKIKGGRFPSVLTSFSTRTPVHVEVHKPTAKRNAYSFHVLVI